MMKGDKSTVFEGGVRNFLAVQGPGVQAGVVDTSLLDITDILPTIADLASLPQDAGGHLPWDGLSFKNLLLTGSDAVPAHGNRGDSLATAQQHDRMVFILGPYCWDANLVPALGANRFAAASSCSPRVVHAEHMHDVHVGGQVHVRAQGEKLAGQLDRLTAHECQAGTVKSRLGPLSSHSGA